MAWWSFWFTVLFSRKMKSSFPLESLKKNNQKTASRFWIAQIGCMCRRSRQSLCSSVIFIQKQKPYRMVRQARVKIGNRPSKEANKSIRVQSNKQRKAKGQWLNTQKANRGQVKLIRGITKAGNKNDGSMCKTKHDNLQNEAGNNFWQNVAHC